MRLGNIFKRKEKGEPVKEEIKPAAGKKAAKKEVVKTPKKERKTPGLAHRILRSPHITEKATDLAGKNLYVFKVYQRANKIEVKKAVEEVFGIDVVAVRIINAPSKRIRLGKIEGETAGYKKAIVKIKKGQTIEVLPR